MLSSIKESSILVGSPKPKFKIWGRSDQWSLRNGCLKLIRWEGWVGGLLFRRYCHFVALSCKLRLVRDFQLGWDSKIGLSVAIWVRSDTRLKKRYLEPFLPWEIGLNILMSSSIGGHPHLQQFSNFVWSQRLKFTSWGWSNQWFLRYSTV